MNTRSAGMILDKDEAQDMVDIGQTIRYVHFCQQDISNQRQWSVESIESLRRRLKMQANPWSF